MRLIQIAVGLFATTGIAWTNAQAGPAIWRCGNTYSEQPCAGGKTISPGAAPSAEQRRQADAATVQNMATGASMERERLKLEAKAQREPILLVHERNTPPAEATPVGRTVVKKKKDRPKSEHFTASYSHPTEKKAKKAAAGGDS
ncbi:hypothetical protein QTI66_17145 [Variovorax sp. J22R133]|uniref:hypothetical protein n=1 Tax=Variovorax brevis TaxID=3053503 RepID=UPI0025762F70|nr:hypothetical protein [Variovorax sp. J22R133]MDM0113888.1 hypothetical protein [Variovorax sp. J22R133]